MKIKKNTLLLLLENAEKLGIAILVDRNHYKDSEFYKRFSEAIDDGVMTKQELEALCIKFHETIKIT